MYACIFAGVHQHKKDVKFQPPITRAVCCDSQHVYIIQCHPPALSVFDWAANHLCDADHIKLGLSADDNLSGIEITRARCFIIAVGDSTTTTHIHRYQAE